MKIYIAGKITGEPNYKETFKIVENDLLEAGHTVLNPSILPLGFEHEEYMHICYAMIDVCDSVYMLSNWKDSKGAKLEQNYALDQGKLVAYEAEVTE